MKQFKNSKNLPDEEDNMDNTQKIIYNLNRINISNFEEVSIRIHSMIKQDNCNFKKFVINNF